MTCPTPLEKTKPIASTPRRVSIGFPKPLGKDRRFFPLTPETAEMLVDRGFEVIIENNAGCDLKYDNQSYSKRGVKISDRTSSFATDIVVYCPEPDAKEAGYIKRNAALFTFLDEHTTDKYLINTLLQRKATVIDLKKVRDNHKSSYPFTETLEQLGGRASILQAASRLADKDTGKGILIGGLPGTIACEVMVIGAGSAGIAAAKAAIGMDSIVRMFDNDTRALADAFDTCDRRIITSVCLPKVMMSALKSADVVVYCLDGEYMYFSSDVAKEMKKEAMVFNLSDNPKPFQGFEYVDSWHVKEAKGGRICYYNVAQSIPRSAAMALANEMVNLFCPLNGLYDRINSFQFIESLQNAVCVYGGCVVSPLLASRLGCAPIDFTILIRMSL